MKSKKYRIFLLLTAFFMVLILAITIYQTSYINKYRLMEVTYKNSGKFDVSTLPTIGTTEFYTTDSSFESLRAIDYDNDGDLEIFILAQQATSSIQVLDPSFGGYDIFDYVNLADNLTKFELGNINDDLFPDIIYCPRVSPFTMSSEIYIHFQDNLTHSYPDSVNTTMNVGGSFQLQDIVFRDWISATQMDFPVLYESSLEIIYYNQTLGFPLSSQYIQMNPGLENLYTAYMICDDIDGSNLYEDYKELLIHGQSFTSGNTYFVLLRQVPGQSILNTTLETIPITGKIGFSDFLVADTNNDGLKDIIALNSNGLTIFKQYQTGGKIFNGTYDSFVSLADARLLRQGNLGNGSASDIVVGTDLTLKIYYDGQMQNMPQTINVGFQIKDFLIRDFDNNSLDDIAVIGFNGTGSILKIYYQTSTPQNTIPPEQDVNFVIGASTGGALTGASAASAIVSPGADLTKLTPSGTGGAVDDPIKFAGSDQRQLDVGMKTPGKWYKRKRAKMYMSSAGIGVGMSLIFLLFAYPIALASSWMVILGAMIAPVGLFFGTYDFIYTGLYEHKGNIWAAYYKGKKKFFWNVFHWIKPILTAVCIFTTIDLFLILTGSNWVSTGILFGVLFAGMVTLLALSVLVFKVGRETTTEIPKAIATEK